MSKSQARWAAGVFTPWKPSRFMSGTATMRWYISTGVIKGPGIGYLPVFSSKRAARKAFSKAQLIALEKAKVKP
jgi:hypothetical protein